MYKDKENFEETLGGYRVKKLDEKSEAAAMTMAKELERELGEDAYMEFVVKMSLPIEAKMRRECPDNPALALIDLWREEQLLK